MLPSGYAGCVFTLRETQQQVRTRLCSSDNSTHSSPSSWPPPEAWTMRDLMAFPISQKEGGASAWENIINTCWIPNEAFLNVYPQTGLLPMSEAHASRSPYRTASSSREMSSRRLSSLRVTLWSSVPEMLLGASSKHLWRALRTPVTHFKTEIAKLKGFIWGRASAVMFYMSTSHRESVWILQQASCRLWLSQIALPAPLTNIGSCWRPQGSFQAGLVICRENHGWSLLFFHFVTVTKQRNSYFWRRTFIISAPIWASCTRGLQRSCMDRWSSAAAMSSGKLGWKNLNNRLAESSRICKM